MIIYAQRVHFSHMFVPVFSTWWAKESAITLNSRCRKVQAEEREGAGRRRNGGRGGDEEEKKEGAASVDILALLPRSKVRHCDIRTFPSGLE